jgi:hypothetical protein
MMDNPFDPEKLRLVVPTLSSQPRVVNTKPPRHKKGEYFLKGPIPMDWLKIAMSLPGHALHVAIFIWLWVGVKKDRTVKVSLSGHQDACLNRSTASRGLKALERAGLVSVKRAPGRKPVVTVNEAPIRLQTKEDPMSNPPP